LNCLGDAVIAVDPGKVVRYSNPRCLKLLGVSFERIEGQAVNRVLRVLAADTREPIDIARLVTMAIDSRVENLPPGCILVRDDGCELFIEASIASILSQSSAALGAVMLLRNTTESWKKIQRLTHRAQHDHLTNLQNADSFSKHLDAVIAAADEHSRPFAVLFIDLDNFKEINDDLGHSVGDVLLQHVAQRLQSCVRTSDIVSRRGGDEFNVLLSEIEFLQRAAEATERILTSLNHPYSIDGREIRCSASIGVSLFPRDGESADQLLHAADAAMYEAKRKGRNQLSFHQADPLT